MAFYEAWTPAGPLQHQGQTLVYVADNTEAAEQFFRTEHALEGEALEIRESAHHSFENADGYMVVGMG